MRLPDFLGHLQLRQVGPQGPCTGEPRAHGPQACSLAPDPRGERGSYLVGQGVEWRFLNHKLRNSIKVGFFMSASFTERDRGPIFTSLAFSLIVNCVAQWFCASKDKMLSSQKGKKFKTDFTGPRRKILFNSRCCEGNREGFLFSFFAQITFLWRYRDTKPNFNFAYLKLFLSTVCAQLNIKHSKPLLCVWFMVKQRLVFLTFQWSQVFLIEHLASKPINRK